MDNPELSSTDLRADAGINRLRGVGLWPSQKSEAAKKVSATVFGRASGFSSAAPCDREKQCAQPGNGQA